MKRFCGILLFLLLLTLGGSGCGSSNKGSLSSSTTFTVTFDSNGGSEVPSVTVTSGDTVEKPADPVKEGYYFGNWFRDNGTFQNAFNFGSDKVSADITLYARWLDSNDLMAEYAVGEIVIGYATGDNPKYVTQNLTLPTKVDSSDISWSSSSGAISSNGTVTRQATDTDVTLTATASYNGKSANRTFELKVIKKRTRDNSKIKSLPLETASSGDISIIRNESGDVVDIEGNYATFDIENADDAIDALTVIKEELGIKNPIEELVPAVITSDKYGAEYQFQQVHNGVKVFGRGLMASANAKGNGDFLHSNLLPSDVIAKADGKNDIGKAAAETAAKNNYTGNVKANSEHIKKVIYALDDYEAKPAYAYVVNISVISADKYINEQVFVNAENGTVINTVSNICNANITVDVQGKNELSQDISFPVTVEYKEHAKTYLLMYNQATKYLPSVVIYEGDLYNLVRHEMNETWDDRSQISAYTNMLEIMGWWKRTFDRDSLNRKGMAIDIVTHPSPAFFGNSFNDNAAWCYDSNNTGDLGFIIIGDLGNTSTFSYSPAVGIDTLVHETTHGVLFHDVLSGGTLPAFINEAYADVFGCIWDQNWVLDERLYIPGGEKKYLRNIKLPNDPDASNKGPSKISDMSKYDTTDPHRKGLIISHASYLMHKDYISKGLTWNELGQVWYKSIHMGLLATSDFQDVRRCVVWAAQEMEMSSEKLAIIKAAFDEVEIKEQKEKFGSVHGKVQEMASGNKAIEGAKVTAFETRLSNGKFKLKMMEKTTTKATGEYSIKLEAGNYTLSFDKDGYEELSHDVSIKSSEDIEINIGLKKANSVSGVVLSKDETPLSGVTVRIFEGQSATSSELNSTTTDVNGKYSISLKKNKSGYYTLKFSKSGYKTETLTVYVSGEVKDQKTYLEKNNGTGIAGTVYDSKDGTAISGVSVQLFEGGEGKTESVPVKTATTDSNGEYSFNLNENGPGDYTITLAKEGYKGTTDTVSVSAGNVTEHETYLEREDNGIPIDEEHFPDENFRNFIKDQCDRDRDDFLNNDEITEKKMINVAQSNIRSLQGIKYFKALEELTCSDNLLTSLDVSSLTSLQYLFCHENQLTHLDVSDCSSLIQLYCDHNNFTTLSVKNCTSLLRLYCDNNQLISLDVGNCISLETLSCNYNNFTTLDLCDCIALTSLSCKFNQLTVLDVSSCIALQNLSCSNNQITWLDVSNCSKSIIIYCDNTVTVWPASVMIHRVLNTSSLQNTTLDEYNENLMIVASLPSFTVERTNKYSFDVSLDRALLNDSKLFFLNSSEDLQGTFTIPDSESFDHVQVSAKFEAGKTYSPVIAAHFEAESSGGGCNAEVSGLFALMFVSIIAKRRFR